MIVPAQSRAARALLDWSQQELAARCRLGLSTVRDFEKGRRLPSAASLATMERTLEAAGVELIADKSGTGVKLRADGDAALHSLIGELTKVALHHEAADERQRETRARFAALVDQLRRAHAPDPDAAARIRSDLRRLDKELLGVKAYLLPEDSVRAVLEDIHGLIHAALAGAAI